MAGERHGRSMLCVNRLLLSAERNTLLYFGTDTCFVFDHQRAVSTMLQSVQYIVASYNFWLNLPV